MNEATQQNTSRVYVATDEDLKLTQAEFSAMKTHSEEETSWVALLKGHGYMVAIDEYLALSQKAGFGNSFHYLIGKAQGVGAEYLLVPTKNG